MSEHIQIPGISAHLQLAVQAGGFTFKMGPPVFEGGQWWNVHFESEGRRYSAWVWQKLDGTFGTESYVKYHPADDKRSRLCKNPGALAKIRDLADRLNRAEVAA